MKKAKVINVSNVSGGVGKSTTSIELATYFGMLGKRVLLVDADMQASATDCVGEKGLPLTEKELDTMSKRIENGENVLSVLDDCLIENVANDLCEVLDEPDSIKDVIITTSLENVDLLPSSIRLCQADKNLSDDNTRSAVDRMLYALENVKDEYDYIIIDNSPAQTLVSTNTLLASDLNIVPVKSDRKSVKGMIVSLKNTLTIMRRNKKEIELKILFTMVPMQKDKELDSLVPWGKCEKTLIPWFRKHMSKMVFDTVIPYQKKPVQDASMTNTQIVHTNSKVAEAYKCLANEIIALFED